MNLTTLLGRRIKELRKAKKMSQAGLAEATGLSDNYIALVEQGKRSPSLETIEKIASAIKVPYEELFYFQQKDSKKAALKALLDALKNKEEGDILLVSKLAEAVVAHLTATRKRKSK